jgi:hypothetical protein
MGVSLDLSPRLRGLSRLSDLSYGIGLPIKSRMFSGHQPAPTRLQHDERLAELEREERGLSAKRRRVQERIDFLQAGGDGFAERSVEHLESLRQAEAELSRRRRDLHVRIDSLRTAAGLPSYRDEQREIRQRLPHD